MMLPVTTAYRNLALAGLTLIAIANSANAADLQQPIKPEIYCERKWGEDFVMRKHCIDQQWAARKKFVETYTSIVKEQALLDESLFFRIVARCAEKFGDDFVMVEHCTSQQMDAYFSLNQQQK